LAQKVTMATQICAAFNLRNEAFEKF
jgi:hypothetical protein